MLFDDRLATVLRQSASNAIAQRTQLRQLLDLLGNRPEPLNAHEGVREQSLLAAAWYRMDALAEAIPATDRARIIREPGWRFRSPELTAYLAEQEPEVAAAALTRAELTGEQWTQLIPQLPIRARGFLRLRRDLPIDAEALLDQLGVHDRGLPAPVDGPSETQPEAAPRPAQQAAAEAAPETALHPTVHLRAVSADPAAGTSAAPSGPPRDRAERAGISDLAERESLERSEISALVERIAQFRRDRSDAAEDLELSPRLPLGEAPDPPRQRAGTFGFITDASGRIEWASGGLAPMVIGTRLVSPIGLVPGGNHDAAALARAFSRRQPIARQPISLRGAAAIAGDWLVDAEPRFTPEGHFAGYLGRFRRPDTAAPAAVSEAAAQEADRIRELLHELRTPVTAVQGYAEVIQQQLFGAAPHEYRSLAAAIAADAAHILAGFDELDRLARLETGALTIMTGEADLVELVRQISGQLAPVLAPRQSGLALAQDRGESLLIALDQEEAEGLLWRLLATLAGNCQPGERLTVHVAPVFEGRLAAARLICDLPARLREAEDLFGCDIRHADPAISAGLFGAGISLRLARAEAIAAGGSLLAAASQIILSLPLITGEETNPKAMMSHTAA